MTQSERFWSKVNITGNCWLWTARKIRQGYGHFGIGSRTDGTRTLILAHRQSWIFANGPIPSGKCVLHRCDNPSCVNPAHLFLGTIADNGRDMAQKNRSPHGMNNHNCKLTEDQVHEIVSCTTMTQRELAQKYGVSHPVIWRIRNGKRKSLSAFYNPALVGHSHGAGTQI